ncbi:MAG TPA: nucleotide exchange factor GrpE [Blastocatellia bacterium]|jgi:molecular chaperone GrpE
MNSNLGNQEKGQSAAEAQESGTQPTERTTDQGAEPELIVTDKRRFSSDGEAIEREQDFQKDLTTEPATPSEVEELRARFKEAEEKRIEAERQVRDFADRFRHAQAKLQAETDEQRARLQRTFDQKLEAARGDVIAGLLDTLDNLKRAVAAAEKSDNKDSDFIALLDGVRATANMFEARMQGLGLSAVPSRGEEFNPEVHEAVEIVRVAKDQDNRVIEEFQTGYTFGSRLLRPARVRVGRANE